MPIDTRSPDTSAASSLAFGGYLLSDDVTLRQKLGGQYAEYKSLLRDPLVTGQWRQFMHSIVSNPLRVKEASDSTADVVAAQLVASVLGGARHLPFSAPLLGAEPIGWQLGKLKWVEKRTKLNNFEYSVKVPAAFTPMPLDTFRWKAVEGDVPDDVPIDAGENYRLVQLTQNADRDFRGFPRHFLEHTCFAFWRDSDSPLGRGWFEILWWWIRALKQGGLGSWTQHLEQNGFPTVVITQDGKQAGGTTGKKPKNALEAVQVAIANRSAIDFSEFPGTDAKFLAAPGNISPEKLCDYIDTLVRMFIHGPNLTSRSEQTGSQALGREHTKISRRIYKAAGDELCRPLSRLARWITEENVPGATPPELEFVFPNQDEIDGEVERWVELSKAGYRPTLERVQQVLGDGYELIPQATPTAPPIELAAASSAPPVPPDILMLDAVDKAASPHLDRGFEAVRDLLRQVKTDNPSASDRELFTIAQQRMWGVFPEMQSEVFARAFSSWNAGANLAGQYDVRGEAVNSNVLRNE